MDKHGINIYYQKIINGRITKIKITDIRNCDLKINEIQDQVYLISKLEILNN
jgi:hypothetical protein